MLMTAQEARASQIDLETTVLEFLNVIVAPLVKDAALCYTSIELPASRHQLGADDAIETVRVSYYSDFKYKNFVLANFLNLKDFSVRLEQKLNELGYTLSYKFPNFPASTSEPIIDGTMTISWAVQE